MLDLGAINGEDIVDKLDQKIDASITNLLECCSAYQYSVDELDQKINADETLREYIRDTEATFRLFKRNLDNMDSDELTAYVRYLDSLWEV